MSNKTPFDRWFEQFKDKSTGMELTIHDDDKEKYRHYFDSGLMPANAANRELINRIVNGG